MRTWAHTYILFVSVLCLVLTACKKHDKGPASVLPTGNYFPLKTNNQWVYAINDVYYGADTLRVKVVGNDTLLNKQVGWALYYLDQQGFYNDTNYIFVSHDTVLTYAHKNADSLIAKWVLADVANNNWTGTDTSDKYTFEAAVDSFGAFGFSYRNIWNIGRRDVQYNYSNQEQLFFEENIGLCYYSTNVYTPSYTMELEWHLISYQLF